MELKVLKCPQCGASFQEDKKVSFCSYCGAKLFFDDGTKTVNYNYKNEDVTRIKEIEAIKEIKIKKMEIQQKRKDDIIGILVSLVSIVIFYILIYTLWRS